MVFNYLIIYWQNTGHSVDCLKFCIDLMEGLLVKYSVWHKVSSHLHGDNTVKANRMPFSKNNIFYRKTCKSIRQCSMHDSRRETVYYCLFCEVTVCVDGYFEGFHTRNIIEVM